MARAGPQRNSTLSQHPHEPGAEDCPTPSLSPSLSRLSSRAARLPRFFSDFLREPFKPPRAVARRVADAQTVLKFVHLLAVSFLLGGLGAQAAWKTVADRSRDAKRIADAHDSLLTVDRWITGPSALATFATGYAVIRVLGAFGGSIGGAAWALWGLILLFVSLAIWYFVLRPTGHKLADLADEAVAKKENLPPAFGSRSATWFAAWFAVVGLVVVVAGLMVFKPGG